LSRQAEKRRGKKGDGRKRFEDGGRSRRLRQRGFAGRAGRQFFGDDEDDEDDGVF